MQKKYFLILLFSIIINSLAQEKPTSILTQLQKRALGQRSTLNLSNFELFRFVPDNARQISSVEFSKNGLLAIAIVFYYNTVIRIYDISGELLKELHSEYVIKSMSWSSNGKYLLTFSFDNNNNIGIWDIEKEIYIPIDYGRDFSESQHCEILLGSGFIGNDKIFICDNKQNMKIYDLQAKRIIVEERFAGIDVFAKIRLTPDHSKIIIRRDQRDGLVVFDLKTRQFQALNFEHMAHDFFFSYYGDHLYVVQNNQLNEDAREQAQLKIKLTIIDLRTMATIANNVDCELNFDNFRNATTQFVTPDVTLTKVVGEILFFDFKQNKEIYYKKLNNQWFVDTFYGVKTFNNLMAFHFEGYVIVYKIYDVNKIASLLV